VVVESIEDNCEKEEVCNIEKEKEVEQSGGEKEDG
jgi:hypothetical protein